MCLVSLGFREHTLISTHMEFVLIVTGAATASMLAQFIAPLQVLRLTYGEAPADAVSVALARHWGLLLFCIGVLLIYAAFHPVVRGPIVILAAVEKVGFVACVLGTSLRKRPVVAVLAAGDALMVVIYGLYLAGL